MLMTTTLLLGVNWATRRGPTQTSISFTMKMGIWSQKQQMVNKASSIQISKTPQRMFADLETEDQEAVKALVDGNTANNDIYAVGDHIATDVQALRGFQSVEMWWNYIDCTEARTAVGEDNGALTLTGFNDPFTTETEDIRNQATSVKSLS